MSDFKDQYSAKASAEPSLSERLVTLRAFIKSHSTVTLTTRAPDGSLHSRTMAPAEITKDWLFRFVFDKDSYKETEVENDNHVNISIDGGQGGNGWVSIAGKASVKTDDELIKHLYNPTVKAWFGDKGDGVHDGGPTDPRIACMQVKVDEIRHFHQERTQIGTIVDIVSSAIGGNVATPGSIRTITGEEIAAAWAKGELEEGGK
ncbi:hypothetical protein P7C73_g6554, partial [Tremellales sp. Uapishka_1]